MNSTHKQILVQAVKGILRPLIRVLIRNEFIHSELTELVRQTYVDVAYEAYRIPGQEMTVSRVAVLTGLSRKEVVRLKKTLDDENTVTRQSPNRAQRVVHGWLSDPEFLNRKKKPIDLPIKGDKASFLALVHRYSGDITYGAVLDELNHVGVTVQPDCNTVRLVNPAYIPHKDELGTFQIMCTSVADLLKTAVHNIESKDGSKRFQRQVVYSGIEKSLAEKFRQLSTENAATLMDEMNQYLSSGREKSEADARASGGRVGMGIYYFEDPAPGNISNE